MLKFERNFSGEYHFTKSIRKNERKDENKGVLLWHWKSKINFDNSYNYEGSNKDENLKAMAEPWQIETIQLTRYVSVVISTQLSIRYITLRP